jgi:hypothetical protein
MWGRKNPLVKLGNGKTLIKLVVVSVFGKRRRILPSFVVIYAYISPCSIL